MVGDPWRKDPRIEDVDMNCVPGAQDTNMIWRLLATLTRSRKAGRKAGRQAGRQAGSLEQGRQEMSPTLAHPPTHHRMRPRLTAERSYGTSSSAVAICNTDRKHGQARGL